MIKKQYVRSFSDSFTKLETTDLISLVNLSLVTPVGWKHGETMKSPCDGFQT